MEEETVGGGGGERDVVIQSIWRRLHPVAPLYLAIYLLNHLPIETCLPQTRQILVGILPARL